MKPFPKFDELQFLLASEPVLTMIGVNPYGLTLNLDNGCAINSEEGLTYVDQAGVYHCYAKEWRNEKPIVFHALLEQRLVALDRDDLALTLRFSGGGVLVLPSVLGPYESGQIYSANGGMDVY